MATYLDRILARHRERAAADPRTLAQLAGSVAGMPPGRDFAAALVTGATAHGLAVIAEVKRRSPSKGDLNAALEPAALARQYARGGASCLSVLTDEEFFGGSAADLAAARAATALPVLRKDFTVGPADVYDARAMGADCILLIAAALGTTELADLHALARSIGLDVLVEIHDDGELAAALAAGARLIGVNQRDLVTFEVDHDRAARMARIIPEGIVKVAESGVRGAADAARLRAAGYDAVLVGETLVTSPDPAAAIRELLGVLGRSLPDDR